jgi:hypothetical protein
LWKGVCGNKTLFRSRGAIDFHGVFFMISFSKLAITVTLSLLTRPAAAQEVSAEYFEPAEWEIMELTPTSQPANSGEFQTSPASAAGLLKKSASAGGGMTKSASERDATTKSTPEGGGVRSLGQLKSTLDQAEIIVDQVINTGKKVWAVVEAGKPVVNVRSDVATALPATTTGAPLQWTQMENWRRPESKLYGAILKNAYGVEVVRFSYRVLYVAGGSVGGQGRYIGYATIQPAEVNVAWGYNFTVEASAPTVFNMGTKVNPIAGMNLELTYIAKTVLKEMRVTKTYFISGDGQFQEMN